MTPRLSLLLALVLGLGSTACGGDDDAACGSGPSLAILAPQNHAELSMADDVDPTLGGLQIDLAVRACNIFSTGSQIEVWETETLMTRYAVLDTESDDDVAETDLTLVPGELTFEARTVDGETTSAPVTIHVTLE